MQSFSSSRKRKMRSILIFGCFASVCSSVQSHHGSDCLTELSAPLFIYKGRKLDRNRTLLTAMPINTHTYHFTVTIGYIHTTCYTITRNIPG